MYSGSGIHGLTKGLIVTWAFGAFIEGFRLICLVSRGLNGRIAGERLIICHGRPIRIAALPNINLHVFIL